MQLARDAPVDEHSAVSYFIRTGIGIAFWPESLGEKITSIKLLRINQPICVRTYQITWLQDRYLSKAAHTFREYLISYFASLQARLSEATIRE